MKRFRSMAACVRAAGLGAALVLSAEDCADAQEGVCYSNDFQQSVGTEWSSTSVDITPVGTRRFLGQFGNDAVTLTLADLASHRELTVSFDLYVINSWDGNNNPDVWEVAIVGGPTFLHTTFSNNNSESQAYPDPFPGGDHPYQFGASEVSTLGFGTDAVYQMSFTFPHETDSMQLTFTGSGLQDLGDESWGIDNVRVTTCRRCPVGNVNRAIGSAVDVLFVNGSSGGALRVADIAVGSPIEISLVASPSGPADPRYVVWAWPTAASRPFDLVVGGINLGCVVNPTPFLPFGFPQPFRCLRGGLNSLVCTDVPENRSPARAPWSLTHPGFSSPIELTLQGVLQDDGATNPLGFSVTNAVFVAVH